MSETVECPTCQKSVTLTSTGRYRSHGPKTNLCASSGQRSSAELPPTSPAAVPDEPTATDAPTETPTPPPPVADATAVYSYDQPDRPLLPEVGGYEQPGHVNKVVTQAIPMDDFETGVAAMFKEIFYQYTHERNRGKANKTTVGPSAVGTPCDRRLIMMLMGMPKVNPGGDGWAAFRGTWVHKGLEEMMVWADAGAGRFATEMKLQFKNKSMPFGILDLVDRMLFMVDDHKVMSQWSLDRLKTQGMPVYYRTQLNVYAYQAKQRGEKIDRIGLIGWPGDKSSLDDLYVKSEKYDPDDARAALARLDSLRSRIDESEVAGVTRLEIAQSAAIEPDCRFCQFHMPGAKDLTYGGCNGRR